MAKLFEVFGVEIRIDKDHYSVRLGNTAKGFYAITPRLREETIKTLQELINELIALRS